MLVNNFSEKESKDLFHDKLPIFKSSIDSESSRNSLHDLLDWWDLQKSRNFVKLETLGVKEIKKWNLIENDGLYPDEKDKYFSIKGVRTSSKGREVLRWDQPIVIPTDVSVAGLLLKEFDGVIHLLVQAFVSPGNHRFIQLGPSFQSSSLKALDADVENKLFLSRYFRDNMKFKPLFLAKESEEGARFYHKQILHIIKELPEEESFEIPENFTWMTLHYLKYFIHAGEYVNLHLRSLITCLL